VIPPVSVKNISQQKLLKLFDSLSAADRQHLLVFAEFLVTRTAESGPEQGKPAAEPRIVPRPENETVIAAIKRLSSSYSMLDKSEMLHETSDLVTSHVIKGRAAGEVIDELEVMFLKHYQKKLNID